MAVLSKCPNCQEPVSIPLGVEAAASVRCPLCGAEYSLGVAMAMAPPELQPVPSDGTESPPLPADLPVESGDSVVETPVDEAAAVAAQFVPTPASVHLRARRQKSGLRAMIEIVSGGLAGCLVAYYALALWFGPQFSNVLPRLPLPFIEQLTAAPKAVDTKESVPTPKKTPKAKATLDNKPADAKSSNDSKPAADGNLPDDLKRPAERAKKSKDAPPPTQSGPGLPRPGSGAKIMAFVQH